MFTSDTNEVSNGRTVLVPDMGLEPTTLGTLALADPGKHRIAIREDQNTWIVMPSRSHTLPQPTESWNQ